MSGTLWLTMKTKHLRPLKAIRQHCLDCMGGRPSLVRTCDSETCSLWSLRSGKNPLRKGLGGRLIINTHSQQKPGNQLNDSGAPAGAEGLAKASGLLTILEAPNKKSGWPGVSVSKKGQVEIKGTEEGILIKITNDLG